MKSKDLKFILITFLIWQIAIGIIIFLGTRYFPTTNQYLYTEKQTVVNPSWLWSRANFDGMHYLDIARKGYGIYQQAFFPLYPRLIALLTPFFNGKDLVAGWSVSVISLFLLMLIFYKLVESDFSQTIAKRSILYLLIFPTAFFFSMVYTESLFLLLVLLSFYFARSKRWWLAGIFGALASATRLPGIFLLPALAVEFWRQHRKKKEITNYQLLITFIPLILIPLGLLYYMRFLQINYQDPLMFLRVQPYFGAGREAGKIVLLYQVFWRYFKMLVTVDKFTHTYFVVVLEFLSGAGFLALTIFTYFRRWYSYLVFMALAYIAPTLTGTFSSMPRYVLILFPGFILLALWAEKYRWIRILYPAIAILLFILCLLLFTRGYWVA
jgi:Gpi18-like mannosyltransferase